MIHHDSSRSPEQIGETGNCRQSMFASEITSGGSIVSENIIWFRSGSGLVVVSGLFVAALKQ